MPTPDYGDVAKALVRVIESTQGPVEPEILTAEQAVLETLVPFVGQHEFRLRIPREQSVEFNFDLEGVTATLSYEAPRTELPSSGESRQVPAKQHRFSESVYWPKAEECLTDAFARTEGGVALVFVGEGFWNLLHERKLLTDGNLGSAKVVMLKNQPDRDVFLIGHLEGPVIDLDDIPPEKMARVTVVTQHVSLSERTPQLGAKKNGGQRLLSLEEQRTYLAEMDPDERDQEMAMALENVRDSTAKSTLRSLFPHLDSHEILKFLQRIRKIRPCAVSNPKPVRAVSNGVAPGTGVAPGQNGRVVGRVGSPVMRTTVTDETEIPDADDDG